MFSAIPGLEAVGHHFPKVGDFRAKNWCRHHGPALKAWLGGQLAEDVDGVHCGSPKTRCGLCDLLTC